MTVSERIYIVRNNHDNTTEMVKAKTRAQALAAVTSTRYDVSPATAVQVAELCAQGTEIRTATSDAAEDAAAV